MISLANTDALRRCPPIRIIIHHTLTHPREMHPSCSTHVCIQEIYRQFSLSLFRAPRRELLFHCGCFSKEIEDLHQRRSDNQEQEEGNQCLADRKLVLFFASSANGDIPTLGNILIELGVFTTNLTR